MSAPVVLFTQRNTLVPCSTYELIDLQFQLRREILCFITTVKFIWKYNKKTRQNSLRLILHKHSPDQILFSFCSHRKLNFLLKRNNARRSGARGRNLTQRGVREAHSPRHGIRGFECHLTAYIKCRGD